eukprot:1087800-Rhodomonas_salina.1
MQALPDGAWVDGEASTLPFVLLNQHAPDDQPLQNAFRASNVIYQPAMTWYTSLQLKIVERQCDVTCTDSDVGWAAGVCGRFGSTSSRYSALG